MIPGLRGDTIDEDRVLVAAMLGYDGWRFAARAIVADLLDHAVTGGTWTAFDRLVNLLDEYSDCTARLDLLQDDPRAYLDKYIDDPATVELVVFREHEIGDLEQDRHATRVLITGRLREITGHVEPVAA